MSWEAVKAQFRATWLTTFFSIIVFAGITYFIVWAENQTIATSLALEELMGAAVEVRTGAAREAAPVAAEYEGRVVHVVGPLQVLEPITEPDYNIQVQAVKLRRRVQMYQWVEETSEDEAFVQEPSEDSRRTHWYHKDWRDYVVDSSLFYNSVAHKNPRALPLASETHIADNVKIGSFYLDLELKRQVNDYYAVWSDARPERGDIKLHGGFYYHGESALTHEVGDLRVSFTYAGREDDIYTAVGLVEGGALHRHHGAAAEGTAAEGAAVLRKGSYSLQQLLQLERSSHRLHTWKYRALGLAQVFAAAMTLHPDWLTILLGCGWLSPGFQRSSRLWVTLVLTVCYTLVAIACPWLVHKPTYGALVLGCAALPLLHYSTLLTRRPPHDPHPHHPHRT